MAMSTSKFILLSLYQLFIVLDYVKLCVLQQRDFIIRRNVEVTETKTIATVM